MAEPISIQQLKDASLDVKSLEEVVNGNENVVVTTRLGETYPSVKGSIKKLFENGGLPATPFTTKALMTASALADGKYAMVTDDTVNNGLYVKTTGSWVKSEYDPLVQAKAYADDNKIDLQDITYEYEGGNVLGDTVPRYTDFGVSSAYIPVKSNRYDSIVLEVTAGEVLYIFNDEGSYTGGQVNKPVFFAEDPYLNQSQARVEYSEYDTEKTDSDSSITYLIMTVPDNAKYMVMNTRFLPSTGDVRNWEWAVHRGEFRPTYEIGEANITKIKESKISPDFKSKSAKEFADEIEEKAFTSSKSYTDLVNPVIKTGVTDGNLITDNVIKITDRGLSNNGNLQTSASGARAIVLPVMAGQKLYINKREDVAGIGGVFSFFANNPIADTSQSPISYSRETFTDAASGIAYFEVTVPDGAKYLVLNTEYSGGAKFTWAVHLNEFIPSFDLGQESVVSINGTGLITGFELHQLSNLMYSELEHYDRLRESTKNLYNGTFSSKTKVNKLGVYVSADDGDCVTHFIPVSAGQSYTISGLDMSLLGGNGTQVVVFGGPSQDEFIDYLTYLDSSGTTTILIEDPAIKYIAFPITSGGKGTVEQAAEVPLQVEQGTEATTYEPYIYSPVASKMLSGFSPSNDSSTPTTTTSTTMLSSFIEMNRVRNEAVSTLGTIRKNVGSTGIRYIVSGDSEVDSTSNNLFAQTQITSEATRNINVHLMKLVDGVKTLGDLKATPFTVPSGQFDNPDTLSNYSANQTLHSYVHPSIAYDATGVGGFKYWMMASTLPTGNMGDSTWEDEDVFVSNDAKTWQRVRSLYEDDKEYTTDTLRLPPHSLANTNARKHAFLPCPSVGDTIEISVPENNGAPALDRVNITLIALPWKHDPFIMFDGGFLYAYVSYHLPYADRTGGKNRFIVCVRTSNGIDWDVVRSDGSTMRLTEENSKTLFTKDEQGRYNYIAYFYSYGGSNPEIIKYGEGDYEFIYGGNFSRKYSGTTPYNFDFSTYAPFKDLGSGNHPTLLLNEGTLYLMNNKGFYASTDRGTSFTKYDKNPTWVGGVTSYDYKKTMCVGDGGKLIYVDTQRLMTADSLEAEGRFTTSNNINLLTTYEYPSVADFVSKATTGLADAYIDVQIVITNQETKKRTLKFYPAVSLTTMTHSVNNPMQRITIDSVDFKAGDLVTFYVTLNSRNGAEIQFGGIDIT